MPRPPRCRRICEEPAFGTFGPEQGTDREPVILQVDEYETIRLVDLEGATHEECARIMDISRTTVTEIYESARHKIADALVNGRELRIAGGNYRLCDGSAIPYCQRMCEKGCCAIVQSTKIKRGDNVMRIAVTYDNGNIFQHFGKTQAFKVYEVEDGKVVRSGILDTNGQGHGALAGLLMQNGIDTLICGGIGGGAQNALRSCGIQLLGGVSGNADAAVEQFLANSLQYDPNVHCDHPAHEGGNCHGHDEGGCCH